MRALESAPNSPKARKTLRKRMAAAATLIAAAMCLQPATLKAFDVDTHYVWTYYLARHVGFTARQAFQIASAAFSIDHDPQTSPMEAGILDATIGAETWGNERLVNIWRNFHCFGRRALAADALEPHPIDLALPRFAQVGTRVWATLMGKLLLGQEWGAILDEDIKEVAGWATDVGGSVDVARRQSADALFDLALQQHNPGPYIHFVQDYTSHFEFTDLRGHALAGHVPDFLSFNRDRSWAMTMATISALQRFMVEDTTLRGARRIPDYHRLSGVLDRLIAASAVPTESGSPSGHFHNLNPFSDGPPGSPSRRRALDIVDEALRADEQAGRITAMPERMVDESLPYHWQQFNFDGAGRTTDPAFRVEKMLLDLNTPVVEFNRRAGSTEMYEVTVSLTYHVSGMNEEVDFLPGVPVYEEFQISDFNQPRIVRSEIWRNGTRMTQKMVFERPLSLLRSGSLSWKARIHVHGLEPVERTVIIRYDGETTNDPQATCVAATTGAEPRLTALRQQATEASAALATIQSARSAAEPGRARAESVLARLETIAADTSRLRSNCSLVAQEAQDIGPRIDWAAAQAKIRDEKASYLATIACELASEARSERDPAVAARHASGADGFARQARGAADEAQQLLQDARQRAARAERAAAELEAVMREVNARRTAQESFRGSTVDLRSILSSARRAEGGLTALLESASAEAASVAERLGRESQACPALIEMASSAQQLSRDLFANRNLAIGEQEALRRATADLEAAILRVETLVGQLEDVPSSCEGLSGVAGALRSAVDRLGQIEAAVASARDSASRAEDCARSAAPLANPTPTLEPPGAVVGDSPRDAGNPGPSDPSGPPGAENPRGPGVDPSSPWDQAVRGRPPGGGSGNPWDDAVRGRDPSDTGQPGTAPSGSTTPGTSNSSVSGTTTGGSQGGPATPSLDDLLGTIATLADPPACNYEAAAGLLAQASSLAPTDPRVMMMNARLQALMGGRAAALASYRQAQGQLAANDLGGALASARAARAVGPPCDRANADSLIALIENALNRTKIADDRQRATDDSRAAAAAVLGGLIDIFNRGVAAQDGGVAPVPPSGTPAGSQGGGTTPGGQPASYCSIQHANAADEPDLYWAVISFAASPRVTNYMVMPFRKDGVGPDEWVRTAGAQMGGAGRSQVQGRGTRQAMDGLARQLCPNPATPPGGMAAPVLRR